jgi:PKD repeat protein
VSLGIELPDDVPGAITVQFADDLEGITTLSAEHSTVNVVISVPVWTPGGEYVIYFSGQNGQLTTRQAVGLQVEGNVPPVVQASPDQTASEGDLVSMVLAIFHDLNEQDTHTATINWGDGTEESGQISGMPSGTVPVQPPVMDFIPTVTLYVPLIGKADSGIAAALTPSQSGSAGTVSGSHVYADNGTYTVEVCVKDQEGAETCDTLTITVENLDPAVAVDVASQTVQYSDAITDVSFTATDVAADTMTGADSYDEVDGGGFVAGLPSGMALTDNGCSVDGGIRTCTWTVSGQAGVPAGTYTVRLTVTDDDGGSASVDTVITVLPEDASVSFGSDNRVAVKVSAPGEDSGEFSLTVDVKETESDAPPNGAQPGDIGLANVSMSLVPVGPGGMATGDCSVLRVLDEGYDAFQRVECSFDEVPANTYSAEVTVDGGYYAGLGEDVLTVYDPSLGFTTAFGWFYWPGTTTDKTNFGYTMKYNKKATNLRGSLLLVRHVPDGTIYRVKSNALDGLSLGEAGDPVYGWASFSGKCTYKDPAEEPVGNHQFLVYVEDHGEPDAGQDRFWIEVRDGDGNVIVDLSMDREAMDHTEALGGGNIVVPPTGHRVDLRSTPGSRDAFPRACAGRVAGMRIW